MLISPRRATDKETVVWTRRSLPDELEACLKRLPERFDAIAIGPAWFVTGPTGVFVVMAHDGSIERARALGRLAATVRSALAERMAWVPFVHAMLIDDQSTPISQATVVPPGLLADVLTEGRVTLEVETLDTIAHLVADGVLDGLESVAPGAAGARMTSCYDFPAATASSSPSTTSVPSPEAAMSSSPMPPGSTVSSGNPSPGA